MLVLVVCVGVILLTSTLLTLALLFPPKEWHRRTPADVGLDYESMRFTTPTGARLAGWFIPQRQSQGRTVVVLHGICSNKSRFVGCARELHDRGFNVLLVDLRGHGQSSRGMTTYGHLEQQDIGYVLDTLSQRPDVDGDNMALMGHSLGGAVALQTLPHPRVKAVVADSAFAHMAAMLHHRGRQFRLPSRAFVPLAQRSVWLVARFDLCAVSPATVVRTHEKPVFLVHGTHDRSVPYSHAVEMAEAPHVRLWTVPQAGHLEAHREVGYFDQVAGFLQTQLSAA